MNGSKKIAELQGTLTNVNQDNFLRNMVQASLQKALDSEFLNHIGAQEYERTEARNGHRNGSYERQFKTRVGAISLQVCRDRAGEFQPELFERYQRSEKAFVLGITEMYFSGVSTRKVSAVLEELCGVGVSKSKVSELVVELDEHLVSWRGRPLTKKYCYLVFDARYEKVREYGRVISKAFVVAIGIATDGIREVIGCWVVNSESFEAWDACISDLRERGLNGVEFAVSDQNKGLRVALSKYFQGALLQRCQVHFMRNFLDKLSKSDSSEGKRLLQDVFAADTQAEAKRRTATVKEFLLRKKKESVVEWLEDAIEETLPVLQLPAEHRKKMRSTNMIERLNQELKKRSRVVRIFPNAQSCLRLLSALCQEMSEEWCNRKYINMTI